MNNLPEKILSIEEVYGVKEKPDSWLSMEGYKVTTDKQVILLLIDNRQSCCESWGMFESNDDVQDFVGSNLLDITLVDDCLNQKKLDNKFEYGFDDGDIMFVNFETDKGTLQLAVYNSHNGYYSHSVLLKSNQVTRETYL